jgi:hypothetical protein
MDTFECAGERERIIDVAATSFGCRKAKNRSQSFPTSEKTITHRLVKCCGFRIRPGQISVQGAVDQLLASDEIRFEIHVRKPMLACLILDTRNPIPREVSSIKHQNFAAE